MVAKSNIAKAGARALKPTESPLADLASRTSTGAATAVRAASLATGNNMTGQYLYDRLIGDDSKADLSKMDIVRMLVPRTADEVKKLIGDFVGVAKGYLDNAVDTAKKVKGYDDKNPPVEVRDAKSKYKTAQNYQTRMRNAYGALKFASKELKALGGSDTTGFLLMDELGRKALADAGLNWDGTKAEAPKARQARAEQREEAEVLQQVMAEHPRKENENRADYFARIDKYIDKAKADRDAERKAQVIQSLTKKVLEMLGDNFAEVIEAAIAEKNKPQEPAATPDANLH